jgi:hypothetical protein
MNDVLADILNSRNEILRHTSSASRVNSRDVIAPLKNLTEGRIHQAQMTRLQ